MTLSHPSYVRRSYRALGALALSLALAGGSAACAKEKKSDDADDAPSKPAPLTPGESTASGKSADPDQAAKEEALKTYGDFWDAQVKAYAKGSMKGAGVEKYAYKDALVFVDNGVRSMKEYGTRKTGKPTHRAKVSKLVPEKPGKAATATIVDCMDSSSWKTVKHDSGKVVPLPSGQLSRFTVTTKAEDWGERGWRMLEVTPSRRAC